MNHVEGFTYGTRHFRRIEVLTVNRRAFWCGHDGCFACLVYPWKLWSFGGGIGPRRGGF